MQISHRQKVRLDFISFKFLIFLSNILRLKRIEDRLRKEKQKRNEQHEQRKAERAEKYDAIRVKYGLKQGNEYAQMDDK